jgi:hypothetical protein
VCVCVCVYIYIYIYIYNSRNVALRLSEPLTTTTGHYTICCKNLSLTLLKMGKNCPKHVELILEIIKLLLLHLVAFSILLYLQKIIFLCESMFTNCTGKLKNVVHLKLLMYLLHM